MRIKIISSTDGDSHAEKVEEFLKSMFFYTKPEITHKYDGRIYVTFINYTPSSIK